MDREVIVEGKTYRFGAEGSSRSRRICVNGSFFDVALHALPDGRLMALVDGSVVEWERIGSDGTVLVRRGRRMSHLRVADPRRRRSGKTDLGSREHRAEIKAPMPGKVVAVHCEEGQEVAADQGIVVLEAMKMENELRSPIAGKVTALEVKKGQSVEMSQLIAVVEPEKPSS